MNANPVKEIEINHFSDSDTSGLFRNILYNPQFTFAFTNELGEVILSSPHFLKLVNPVAPVTNLFDLIRPLPDIKPGADSMADINFHNGNQTIHLSVVKVKEDVQDVAFLWVISNASEAGTKHKLSVVKNLYRSFIDTTFEMIFRSSVDGRILFSNRLFVKNLGFESYGQMKNMTIESIFQDPEQYKSLQEELSKNKRVYSMTINFRKSDGGRLTGRVNCHLFHDQLGVPVYNWIVLDISHQVEYENTLKFRNEELAKVNHQIEKFLYSTSHDLRSPITSILGLVNIMRMESLDDMMLDYISKIESTTLRLDKIIRDTMSFAITSYKRIASERVDFESVLWKTINSFRSDPVFRRIGFSVTVNGLFPFFADTERLDIVFDNIVRNAMTFYDTSKAHSFININVTVLEDHCLLEFIDNGIGIGKQHHEKIFNMFYKASNVSKGTGLGLYIVKETIGKLRGKIEVESEIGFGTVFRITVPNDHKGKLIGRKLQLTRSI